MEEAGLPPKYLLIDHDGKDTREFDAVFAAEGATVQRAGPQAPNLNAHAEPFAQTLRQQLLDHFVSFGERHRLTEFLTHYSGETAAPRDR